MRPLAQQCHVLFLGRAVRKQKHCAASLFQETVAAHNRRRRRSVRSGVKDTLPEWSKGVDSSSTSASCVGSNPTGVTTFYCVRMITIYGPSARWKNGGVLPKATGITSYDVAAMTQLPYL